MKIITLLIIVLLFSCNGVQKKEFVSPQYVVDIHKVPNKNISFDSIIDEYNYIHLETKDNSLIGKIDKLFFIDKYIFVLDGKLSKSVFQFKNDGTFIRRIGSYGKGPGEYLSPKDILLNKKEKTITIYCSSTKKFLYYNFDGSFVKDIDIGLDLRDLEKINEDILVANAQGLYNPIHEKNDASFDILILNQNRKVLSTHFKNSARLGKGIAVASFNKYFSKTEGNVFYNSIFCDTLYKFDKDLTPKPFLTIDFGNKKISSEILQELSPNGIMKRVQKGLNWTIIRPSVVSKTSVFMAFAVAINQNNVNDFHKIIFDFKTETSLVFHNVVDRSGTIIPVYPEGAIEDKFYSIIERGNFNSIQDRDLRLDLIKNKNKVSNPVIFVYTLNKKNHKK